MRRLEAQRNDLNARVRLLRQELQLLQEPGSYVGEVVKALGKKKVLVKVNPEGKYIVDIDKDVDISKCTANTRVALRSDSYQLHKILPTKVDPLVSLMKVEKVPDSTRVLCVLGRVDCINLPTRANTCQLRKNLITRFVFTAFCVFLGTTWWAGLISKFAKSKK